MKKLFTFIFFLNICLFANSQISLQVAVLRPIGEFGATMKPGFLIEAGRTDFFTEGRFRMNWGGNFRLFTPRLDTFRISGVQYEGSEITVYPGTQTLHPYAVLNAYFGGEFSPLEAGKWFPYIGIDLIAGIYYYHHYYSIEQIESGEETFLEPLLGGRAKIGLEYMVIKTTSVFVQYSFSKDMNFRLGFWTPAWGIGLGVRHEF